MSYNTVKSVMLLWIARFCSYYGDREHDNPDNTVLTYYLFTSPQTLVNGYSTVYKSLAAHKPYH